MLTNTNKKLRSKMARGYSIAWFSGATAGLLREYFIDDMAYLAIVILLSFVAYFIYWAVLGEPEA